MDSRIIGATSSALRSPTRLPIILVLMSKNLHADNTIVTPYLQVLLNFVVTYYQVNIKTKIQNSHYNISYFHK